MVVVVVVAEEVEEVVVVVSFVTDELAAEEVTVEVEVLMSESVPTAETVLASGVLSLSLRFEAARMSPPDAMSIAATALIGL